MLFGGKLYVAPNIFQGNMNSHLIPCYDILYILIQVHVVGVLIPCYDILYILIQVHVVGVKAKGF